VKAVLKDLQLNETLRGKVVEIFTDGELLMSFSGDLVRVQNETRRPFDVGQLVIVIVKAIEPVRFQLADPMQARRRGHLDVSV
jgi:hypothetical protein